MSIHRSTSSIASRLARLALLATLVPLAACAASTEAAEERVEQSEAALAGSSWAWGFAWVNPGSPISSSYSFNSGNGTNTYTGSNGVYAVTMNELGVSGGTVQVVSYGPAATRCKVASWYPSGTAQTINVRCHDASGALAASPFVVFFNKGTPDGGKLAHLYYDGSGVPSAYSFNSAGGVNGVTRNAVGRYTANLPGLAASNSSVHVTAYGSDARYCKLLSWSGSSVEVRCNDATGAPADSPFVLNFSGTTPRPGTIGGHAWIDGPTSASAGYQKNQHVVACFAAAPVTVSGFSSVTYPDTNGDFPLPTTTLSTAYGDDGNFCKVQSWATGATSHTATTICFTPSGARTTSRFTSSFMTGGAPGPC
jgi:hypothetical protein